MKTCTRGVRSGPVVAASLGLLTLSLLSGCTLLSAFSGGKKIREDVQPRDSANSPSFRQATGELLSGDFVPGNNVVTLQNGDHIFPAMLNAIRHARETINFETYVFWDGPIAQEFTAALAERAAAGVKVNAILDAQGTNKLGHENRAKLRNAGVNLVKYHSILWWDVRF